MQQKTVVVANDDPAIIELLRQLFEDEGYVTVTATSGSEAYDAIQHRHPTAAVVDMQMEHKQAGLEVAERIRRNPATAQIPLVICSADPAFLRERSEQIQQYHCYTLEKPFDIDELVDLIDQLTQEEG